MSETRDDADAIICSDALDSADDFATDIDANTTTAAISAPLRLVGGFECVQIGADDDLDDVDDAPDVPFETDDAVTDDAPSLTLDDFNEDECALALDAMSPPSPAEQRGGRERRGFLARLPARLLGPGVAGTVGRIGFRGLAARLRKRAGSQSYAGHNTGLKNGMYGQLVRVFFGKCFNRWRSRRSKWLFSGSFANSPDSENPLEVGHFSSNQIENPRSSLGGQGVERYFYLQLQHIIYFGLKNRNAPSVTRRGGTWLGYSS